jgi:CRP/FNR family transcriptional regulator, cyclic AMP receptor protein
MIERFTGEQGRRRRIEALKQQAIVAGDTALAEALADLVEIISVPVGTEIIKQGAEDTDVYFIIAGQCEALVNGRKVATRPPGQCVGEMVAIEPTQARAATIVAVEPTIVAKIGEEAFHEVATLHPCLYRNIAKELAKRLLARNKTMGAFHDTTRVFLISSKEAIEVARIIQNALSHDFLVTLWTDDVFKVASYPLQALEDALAECDFAIAVAHSDDVTESREKNWPSPRDNVIFELGLFMGRLTRQRAILMEPRDEELKLPSDLAGVTSITYRYKPGSDTAALMAPACNKLRQHIKDLGPYNG